MSEQKVARTLWHSAQDKDGAIRKQLNVSPESYESIKKAFNSQPSEDAVKAFKTPVDTDALAKVVC